MLWYDGKCKDDSHGSRKWDIDSSLMKRQDREDQIDCIFKDLRSKYYNNYSVPQLLLWSRMICTSLHNDMGKHQIFLLLGSILKNLGKNWLQMLLQVQQLLY